MKIVHTCLADGFSDGMTYQENLLAKFHTKNNEVYVIATQYSFIGGKWCRNEKTNYSEDNIYIYRIPYKYNLNYKINKYIGVFKDFYKLLEDINPDIIFCHNLQFADTKQIVKYANNHKNVKVFADNHADYSNSARNWLTKNLLYKLRWRHFAKLMEPITQKFFGVTPSRVDFLKDIYGLNPSKCDLLVMGADDDEVVRASQPNVRKETRNTYGVLDDDFLIVTGGKIDQFKKQTLLLMEAVKSINSCNVKLLLFGSIEKELINEVNELCDGTIIQYIGWANSEQSYNYFAAADLVVFPGRHSVYWEQVAGMGIPMMCKYWEGTTHIDIGRNVIFINNDSSAEIKRNINYLLDNPEKYKKMKEAAQKEAKKYFLYSMIADQAIGLKNY